MADHAHPETGPPPKPYHSVRDPKAPRDGLDLCDRVLYRATQSWAAAGRHALILLTLLVCFGGLLYLAKGVSPWIGVAIASGAVAVRTRGQRSKGEKEEPDSR